jgi:hypothetical protein
MWYIYTTEYYLSTKSEIVSFAGKRMELEIIKFSEKAMLRKTNMSCSLSHVESRPKRKTKCHECKMETVWGGEPMGE